MHTIEVGTDAPAGGRRTVAENVAEHVPGTVSGTRRILVLGTHGQFNVGDELLLETFLTQLGPQHRYVVNSYAPDRTAAALGDRFDVDVFDTAGDRRMLLHHLRRSDAVLFAGGSIVKELYASVGRWRYATLTMVLAIVLAARLLRRPVVMCGVGVGPIDTRTGRLLAGAILRLVDLVSVRDDRSLRTSLAVGARPQRVVRVPDTVFVNPPSTFLPDWTVAQPFGSPRVRIALNLNRDIANGGRWDDFLDELAGALDLVAARTPIEVHALPMQSEFKEHDDDSVLRSFLADRPDWHVVLHTTRDHLDVGRIIAGCDVVVSERLHAIVIAAVLGQPVVGLSYDVKVAELAEQLGIADRTVDVNAPVEPRLLADLILDTVRACATEGQRLSERATEFRRVLDRHFADVRAWVDAPSRRRSWNHDR